MNSTKLSCAAAAAAGRHARAAHGLPEICCPAAGAAAAVTWLGGGGVCCRLCLYPRLQAPVVQQLCRGLLCGHLCTEGGAAARLAGLQQCVGLPAADKGGCCGVCGVDIVVVSDEDVAGAGSSVGRFGRAGVGGTVGWGVDGMGGVGAGGRGGVVSQQKD